jgi:hypothetical protein
VIVVNGNKFKENAYFTNSVAPQLTILASGKLQLMPRAHVGNLMKVMKHAIVIQHQVNNEYNYSLLEFMKMGFPLIHNVPRFSAYGYYYEGNNFDAAAAKIEQVVAAHNPAQYKLHAEQLAAQFSIYNPENVKGWWNLVSSPVAGPPVAGPPVAGPSNASPSLYFRNMSPQNYYHFLAIMLSNLRHVPDYTKYTSVILQCTVDVMGPNKYIQELLQALFPNLRSISLTSMEPPGSVSVPYVPNPDLLDRAQPYVKEAYTFLRERFLPHIVKYSRNSFPKRIYISRRSATKRKVLNEEEVETTLTALGFTTMLFETMGAIEQMAVTRNAECVVSAHGAALANTIFCEPRTRVVELCTGPQSKFQHFQHIAESVCFKHERLVCGAETETSDSNLRVDCAALRSLLAL